MCTWTGLKSLICLRYTTDMDIQISSRDKTIAWCLKICTAGHQQIWPHLNWAKSSAHLHARAAAWEAVVHQWFRFPCHGCGWNSWRQVNTANVYISEYIQLIMWEIVQLYASSVCNIWHFRLYRHYTDPLRYVSWPRSLPMMPGCSKSWKPSGRQWAASFLPPFPGTYSTRDRYRDDAIMWTMTPARKLASIGTREPFISEIVKPIH